MKNQTIKVTGHWQNEPPERAFTYNVALGSWNGKHDAADSDIFYYLDGETLNVGDVIALSFKVTAIQQ